MRNQFQRDILYNRFVNMLAFGDGDGTLEEQFKRVVEERHYDPMEEEDMKELKDKGASKEFLMLVEYDDGEVNPVREKANLILDGGNAPLEDEKSMVGHLWRGELGRAMRIADPQTSRMMGEVFGVKYINAFSSMTYKLTDDGIVVK